MFFGWMSMQNMFPFHILANVAKCKFKDYVIKMSKLCSLHPRNNVNLSSQLIANPCFFCSWLNLTNFSFVFSSRHAYFFVIGIFYSFSSWQALVCYNGIQNLFLHLYSLRPFSYLNTRLIRH